MAHRVVQIFFFPFCSFFHLFSISFISHGATLGWSPARTHIHTYGQCRIPFLFILPKMKLFRVNTTSDVVWWDKASELKPEGGCSASRRSSNLWARADSRGDHWRVNTSDSYLSSHKTLPAGGTKGFEATRLLAWLFIPRLQLFRGQSAIGRRFTTNK